jgi:hypothetical protein
MSFQSPRRIFFLAKTDVVTRVLVTRVEMQEIDSHLLSRNLFDATKRQAAFAIAAGRSLARLPCFH